jgi:hypothetical protein
MTDHPITPPPELVDEWRRAPEYTDGLGKLTMVAITVDRLQYIATQAAQWGADQELEACCNHIRDYQWGWVDRPDGTKMHRAVDLELARRPKPPSLKERALQAWAAVEAGTDDQTAMAVIRRALEALND